jgi:hypothetical protein
MIRDANLEFNPQWTALANPGIGGPVPYVAPTVFTATPATKANPFLTVTIAGGPYTDMMAATHRPLMPAFFPNAIYYSFEFEITPDANFKNIQALEFEAAFCANGIYYDNASQLNYVNPAGHVQAYASPENVWADTEIILPQFTAGMATPVRVNYLVDTVGCTMSTLSLEVMGKAYPLPAQFQKVPGAPRSGWAPGIYVQFQSDLASKGGTFTNKYSNVHLDWL